MVMTNNSQPLAMDVNPTIRLSRISKGLSHTLNIDFSHNNVGDNRVIEGDINCNTSLEKLVKRLSLGLANVHAYNLIPNFDKDIGFGDVTCSIRLMLEPIDDEKRIIIDLTDATYDVNGFKTQNGYDFIAINDIQTYLINQWQHALKEGVLLACDYYQVDKGTLAVADKEIALEPAANNAQIEPKNSVNWSQSAPKEKNKKSNALGWLVGAAMTVMAIGAVAYTDNKSVSRPDANTTAQTQSTSSKLNFHGHDKHKISIDKNNNDIVDEVVKTINGQTGNAYNFSDINGLSKSDSQSTIENMAKAQVAATETVLKRMNIDIDHANDLGCLADS